MTPVKNNLSYFGLSLLAADSFIAALGVAVAAFFFMPSLLLIGLFTIGIGITVSASMFGLTYLFEQKAIRSLSGLSIVTIFSAIGSFVFYQVMMILVNNGSFEPNVAQAVSVLMVAILVFLFVLFAFSFHLVAAIKTKVTRTILEVSIFFAGNLFLIALSFVGVQVIFDVLTAV